MIQQINYINKALHMEIIKPQITISITKGELNTLIAEALTNPDTAATIKRAISPLLANSFPQFPDFTNITLGETAEDGTTSSLASISCLTFEFKVLKILSLNFSKIKFSRDFS